MFIIFVLNIDLSGPLWLKVYNIFKKELGGPGFES